MPEVKLQYPVNHNDQLIDTINVPDRLKIKHLKAMDNAPGEIGKVAALIGEIANLPAYVVDQIDAEDLDTISGLEVFSRFLDKSQETGEK